MYKLWYSKMEYCGNLRGCLDTSHNQPRRSWGEPQKSWSVFGWLINVGSHRKRQGRASAEFSPKRGDDFRRLKLGSAAPAAWQTMVKNQITPKTFHNWYSFRPKIITTIKFKFCLTKNSNFDLPTTKDKTISGTFSQKTTYTSSTHRKRQSILVILHLALICVLGSRIAYILGRRE